MTLNQIIEMAYESNQRSNHYGFYSVASMFYETTDKKEIFRNVAYDFKVETGHKFPYPWDKNRELCTQIKKWLACKLFNKLERAKI